MIGLLANYLQNMSQPQKFSMIQNDVIINSARN